MELNALTFLGLIAACLTTGCLVPQAVKTWRTKKTGDLSLTMYLMMFAGTWLWLAYGFLKKDLALILANVVGLAFQCFILFFKIREMRREK